jgi:hypothetical protein
MFIGLVGAVVVIAVVIVGVFIFNEASAALSAGSGTATITWTSAPNNGDTTGNPPQSFSGNIGGHPVSGVSTFTLPSTFNPLNGSTPADLHNVQFFHYKGTFGGKPFALGVGISGHQDAFLITGTYDGEMVKAVVGPPASPNLSSPPIPFHGTIGKWKVTGVIHFPSGSGQKHTATATYNVTS